MTDPNGPREVSPPQKELCTMRIAFPVMSDEQALDVKRKIGEILQGVENPQMQFSIMSIPDNDNPNARRIK